MPIELWAARLERHLTAEEDAAMLALLPPEIEVGSKIKCEYFQYEIIG